MLEVSESPQMLFQQFSLLIRHLACSGMGNWELISPFRGMLLEIFLADNIS